MDNITNFDALNGLSDEERALALEILKQVAADGSSELLEQLQYGDFQEIPVDIDTFLDDPNYLGSSIWMVDEISGHKKCTLFPYWRETLHKIFPDNLTTAVNTLILTGSIGLGKATPLDSVVLTDRGFIKMGEISLTDLVYGNDGKLHRLLGIFPQGKKPICKITFTDHTSTLCCDEHLWTVYNVDKAKWETVQTKELLAAGLYRNTSHKAHNYKIPVTSPVEFAKKELPINPYLLGALIGDGCLSNNTVLFATNDAEILQKVQDAVAEDYYFSKQRTQKYSYILKFKEAHNSATKINYYNQVIKDLKLNTTAINKHIPTEYLYASVEDRIALLQGLMDTDGFISKDGASIEFTTVSEQLKNDFVWLVQSLGGVCRVRTKYPTYVDKSGIKKIGNLSYNIGLKLPHNICPFSLTRKKLRVSTNSLAPSRYIESIEYVGEDECQCIYIDSVEHLYMTNDFIVTHNTQVAVNAMLYLLYRMLCLKDPYSYFGLMPNDKITFSMLNVTLEAAQGVGWDKLQQMVQASPWFMAHGSLNASRTNPTWQPDKHIELVFGSSNRQVVGRALFCLDGDTEIVTNDGIKKLSTLVDKDIQVVSVDRNNNTVISNSCTVKPTIKTAEEYQIELEDGTVIKCTPNHRLMLKDGTYKEAQYLTEADELAEILAVEEK